MSRANDEKIEYLITTQRAIIRMLLLLCGLMIPSANQEALSEFYSILEGLKADDGKT